MSIAAASGNDFINLTYAPYFVSPSRTAAQNSVAIAQAAADANKNRSSVAPGQMLYVPGNSSQYPIQATQPSVPCSLIGDGIGSTVFVAAGATQFLIMQPFRWRSSLSGAGMQTMTAVTSGANVITGIASTSGWSAGQWLFLVDTSKIVDTNSGTFLGEWLRIKSVDSTTQVTVYGCAEDTYNGSGTIHCVAKTFWQGCRFEGWSVVNSAPTTSISANNDLGDQVVFRGLWNTRCRDIESMGAGDACFMIDTCIEGDFQGLRTRDGVDADPTTFGYGTMLWNGSQDCLIEVHSKRNRHGFTTGGEAMGIPRHCTVRGTARECTGTSWDTHAAGKHIMFDHCQVSQSSMEGQSSDFGSGFQTRAPFTVIKGGLVNLVNGLGVEGDGGGDGGGNDCIIDGLIIRSVQARAADGTSPTGIQIAGDRTTVKNCHIEGCSTNAVQLQSGATGSTLIGNQFRRTVGTTAAAVASSAATGDAIASIGNVARGGYTSMYSSATGITASGDQVIA